MQPPKMKKQRRSPPGQIAAPSEEGEYRGLSGSAGATGKPVGPPDEGVESLTPTEDAKPAQPGYADDAKPKNKKIPYALGTTPFPNHQHPTPAECEQVLALLTAAHGPANRPDTVPKPDNSVSGCGEVPSVLDAVIRTVLSANTANSNSARAFKGLIDNFGLVPECDDDGKPGSRSDRGTVNWDAVRRADVEMVIKAIRSGGMAPTKAARIKGILDTVWEENKKRKQQKKHEIKEEGGEDYDGEEEEGDLSLDYIHELPDDEAREKLTSFDGVGSKTASCVMLFCRPATT